MSKLPVVDWVSDAGRQLFHAVKVKYAAPQYVADVIAELSDATTSKTASEKFGAGHIDPNDYALISPSPMFPCHTKAATWLSSAYYLEQRESLPNTMRDKIENHLAKAAAFWQITDDVAKLAESEVDVLIKEASYDTSIPLRSSAETSAAANWMCRHDIDLVHTRGVDAVVKMASEILSAADSYDLVLDRDMREKLHKLSGTAGCYNGRKVASVIRGLSVSDEATRDAIADTAEDLFGDELQSFHVKIASVLDQISNDRSINPLLVVAPDVPAQVVKLANGAVIEPRHLANLNETDWSCVGLVTAETLHGGPADVTSLTYDQADRLCDVLSTKTAGLIHKPRTRLSLV